MGGWIFDGVIGCKLCKFGHNWLSKIEFKCPARLLRCPFEPYFLMSVFRASDARQLTSLFTAPPVNHDQLDNDTRNNDNYKKTTGVYRRSRFWSLLFIPPSPKTTPQSDDPEAETENV